MSGRATSLDYQIQLAEELRRYLHGFQDRLGYVAQSYRSYSDKLYEAGMLDEPHRNFSENYMEVTVQKIGSLVEQINECDIPFVERYIAELEEMQGRYRA